jgi:hypothetical protein
MTRAMNGPKHVPWGHFNGKTQITQFGCTDKPANVDTMG